MPLAVLVLMTSLCFLRTKFEMLSPLERQLLLGLTFLTFQPQHNLTGGLRLLVKDRLRLATESHLLGVITPLALREVRGFTSFVLCHFVGAMPTAFLSCTESVALLRYIHHFS